MRTLKTASYNYCRIFCRFNKVHVYVSEISVFFSLSIYQINSNKSLKIPKWYSDKKKEKKVKQANQDLQNTTQKIKD